MLSRTPSRQHFPPIHPDFPAAQERLRNGLLDEIRTSLVLVAVTTSTLNALARRPDAVGGLPAFIPSCPIVFPTVRAGLIDGIEARMLDNTDHFFRHLSRAKDNLAGFSGDTHRLVAAPIVSGWRTLCGIGELAVREMNALIGPAESEELHLSDDIHRLLIAVQSGQSPCQMDGRAQLPGWFQRRHHPRMVANLFAELSFADAIAPVLILDVSVGGCGLDRAPPLPIDASVGLKLESGRRLEGKVRWQNGARAGVLFRNQLSFTDPLISAG